MTNTYPFTCIRASYSMGKIDRVKGEEGKTMGEKGVLNFLVWMLAGSSGGGGGGAWHNRFELCKSHKQPHELQNLYIKSMKKDLSTVAILNHFINVNSWGKRQSWKTATWNISNWIRKFFINQSGKTRRKLPALIYFCLGNDQLGIRCLRKDQLWNQPFCGQSDEQLKKTASLENSFSRNGLFEIHAAVYKRAWTQHLNKTANFDVSNNKTKVMVRNLGSLKPPLKICSVLKEAWHENFSFSFFHESLPHSLNNLLEESFGIFTKIRGDIITLVKNNKELNRKFVKFCWDAVGLHSNNN